MPLLLLYLFPIPYSLFPTSHPTKKPATRIDLDEVNRCGRLLRSTFTDSGRIYCPIFGCVRQEVSSAMSPARPLPQSHSLIHTVRYQGATIMESTTWSCGLETGDSRRTAMARTPARVSLQTGRPPALELGHSRACGDPVDVGNRPQFRANGCTGAPEMHGECMQVCTKHALVARGAGSAAPCKADNQRSNSVVPAPAGLPSMSETGLNFAPTDAREPRKCTGNACNFARNAHSRCASKSPARASSQAGRQLNIQDRANRFSI